MIKQLLVFVCAFWFATTAFSQEKKEIYVVQLGNFASATLSDYKIVKDLGLLYVGETSDGQTPIYVGDFETKALAETVLAEAKKKGYSGAFLSPRKLSGKKVSVIQLGGKKLSDAVKWENYTNAGKIAVLPDAATKTFKIISTGFADDAAAKEGLANLKALGYKDAYLRSIDETYLHAANVIETNGIALDGTIATAPTAPEAPRKIIVKGPDTTATPINIPANTAAYKRKSVGELQKVLNEMGAYSGKIDGDNATAAKAAYDAAAKNNKVIQKYVALAKTAPISAGAKTSELQFAINNILSKPADAKKVLEKSSQPIAKAYRAYLMFTQNGDAKQINKLMNEAIAGAFSAKGVTNPYSFDTKSTYSYTTLTQLIQHLRYVQGVDKNKTAFPTWLLEEHPQEAIAALEPGESFKGDYKVEVKDKFMEWEEISLLQHIANDLNTTEDYKGTEKQLQEAQERTQLYFLPKALDAKDKLVHNGANLALWKGMDLWASKDAVNKQTVDALKAVYYKAQLRLEDYYATKGIKGEQATLLAYYTLQTVVHRPLVRYIVARN